MENRFKSWLVKPPSQKPLGTWLSAGAPSTAEALGHCGFDFLVVDMEHVPLAIPDAVALMRAVAATPAETVLRVAWNDQVLVKLAMDAGATTLMFPFIQNAEQAKAAVSYTRYPPDGVRGVAGMHRASRYGQTKDYLTNANAGIAVILQLETPAAIRQLPEIAAVPGVDALFIGPSDLAAAMGRLGDLTHLDVQAAIADAAKAARAAAKPIGILGGTPEMVRRFLDYGSDYAAVSSDIAMMTGRAREYLSSLRGVAAAPASSSPY